MPVQVFFISIYGKSRTHNKLEMKRRQRTKEQREKLKFEMRKIEAELLIKCAENMLGNWRQTYVGKESKM